MTTKEKLQTIADNVPKVYEAGKKSGYEVGKQAEYDAFWDAYQKNGQRTSTEGMFMGKGWNAETLKPKYSIKVASTYMMFAYCGFDGDLDDVFEKRGLTLSFDINKNYQQGYMFLNSNIKKVGTIDLSGLTSANSVSSMFGSSTINTIRNFIPPPCEMNASCWNLALVNLGIGGDITHNINLSRCTKLSKDSITNVVTFLSVDASGKTATFSKTAVNNAFEGGSTGSEWLNLIATKSNWTISLV